MVGQGGVPVATCQYVILNVDRSTPEHEVHPTGSVGVRGGWGPERGTGRAADLTKGAIPDASQIPNPVSGRSERIRVGERAERG